MSFDKEAYSKRFVNVASVCPNKQKESEKIQTQIDDFLAAGGKINVFDSKVMKKQYLDLKAQRDANLERMKK